MQPQLRRTARNVRPPVAIHPTGWARPAPPLAPGAVRSRPASDRWHAAARSPGLPGRGCGSRNRRPAVRSTTCSRTGVCGGQFQRTANFQLAHVQQLETGILSGSHRQFQVTGGGKHDPLPDPMVLQKRVTAQVRFVHEFVTGQIQPPAQERMDRHARLPRTGSSPPRPAAVNQYRWDSNG